MPARIARIEPGHAEAFHRSLDAVARERRFLVSLEAPPLDDVRAFVAANLANGNPQFVALDGDAVVGWCDIVRSPLPVRRHCGTLGMGLLPAYRGQGLGAALLEATLEDARARGFLRVELHVRAGNAAAVALYGKAGFATEGILVRHVLVDGIFDDTLSMALFLG